MKILVWGWYHQNNLGDQLFMEAFYHLFPDYQFIFTNKITVDDLLQVDGVFLGGGSFLDNDIIADPNALDILQHKSVFYIGVGAETDIHPTHQKLMKGARLIAIRNPEYIEKIKQINPKVIIIPDLVYCLPASKADKKLNRSVLFIPNTMVVPIWEEPQWKHIAWNFFKSEMSQALDQLHELEYTIHFLPFCHNPKHNDRYAAIELINATKYKDKFLIHDELTGIQPATHLMSQYDVIVTQRYHGIVLSDLIGTPYISLHHHDKLKNSHGVNLNYYGMTKSQLLDSIKNPKNPDPLPIDRNTYIDLQYRVSDALRWD